MIHFLQGTIAEIGLDSLTINVQGVGYHAFCSTRTLSTARKDEPMHLATHLHVREQEMTLFGFATAAERTMFTKLTTVSGVGPKVGLAILSTLTSQEISEAITLKNGKMIARANGVGPKLGERIVRELQGKLDGLSLAGMSVDGASISDAPTPQTSTAQDVLSALTNLGYKPEQAQKVLAETAAALPEASFDTLLKNTLKSL